MADDTAFNSGLPPEYAEAMRQYQRKLQLAQALQQRSMAEPEPTQVVSGYAVKQSPLAGVSRVLNAFLGTKMGESAEKGIAGVKDKYNSDVQDRMGILNSFGDHPDVQANYARASPFGELQKLAQHFQDRAYKAQDEDRKYAWEEDKFKREQSGLDRRAGANIQAGTGILGAPAALDTLTNGLPQAWQPQAPAPLAFSTDPKGNAGVQQTNAKGEQSFHYAPQPPNVKVQVTPMIAAQKAGLAEWAKGGVDVVKELTTTARASTRLLGTLDQMDALNKNPLNGGPAAGGINFVQGLMDNVGLKVDKNKLADSQYYNSIAGDAAQRVISQYGGNRGVTAQEAAVIQQTVPQLQQSPQARDLLSKTLRQIAVRNIQDAQQASKNFNEAIKTEDPTKFDFGPTYMPNPAPTGPVVTPAQGNPPPATRRVYNPATGNLE